MTFHGISHEGAVNSVFKLKFLYYTRCERIQLEKKKLIV